MEVRAEYRYQLTYLIVDPLLLLKHFSCIPVLLWYDTLMKTNDSKSPKPTVIRKKKKVTKLDPIENEMDVFEGTEEVDAFEQPVASENRPGISRKIFVVGAVVLIVAAIGFRFRYLITPATVNGQPIYIWEYAWKLHTQYGNDQLTAMATERMIDQAVKDANITIEESAIDAEVETVEKEASSSGGLANLLEAQRLTMDDFKQRVRLQLSVRKILADKISVTDAEVDDSFKKNKDFYKGMNEAEAKQSIRTQLEEQKFQREAATWLSGIRESAKVEIKFPGL